MRTLTPVTTHDAWLIAYAGDRAAFMRDTRDTFGNGSKRAEYRRRLFAWQGGACVLCGDQMELDLTPGEDMRAEWSHMMTARRYSDVRAGFRWGNLTLAHMRCNRENGERDLLTGDLFSPSLLFTGRTRDLPMC